MTQLVIFGAGLAGLIAARMLADQRPCVMEAQSQLPNNHHALLRFRSTVVGDVTNIPFKKVDVTKAIISDPDSNPIRDAMIYSMKVSGKLHARSILDTRPVERYIAPPDMIQRLASTATISCDVKFEDWSHELIRKRNRIISTIPVDKMMKIFDWKDVPEFSSRPGWTLKATVMPFLDCQVNATVYSARENDAWYRASLTGEKFMVEGSGPVPDSETLDQAFDQACECFGLDELYFSDEGTTVHEHKYQKISDLSYDDREKVKRFIMWLSAEHNIYSLGRFATWRPKLLLDDLVNDVRVISKLMGGESNYNKLIGKD